MIDVTREGGAEARDLVPPVVHDAGGRDDQRPPARGVRLISNVVMEEGHPEDSPVVLSTFTMTEFRLNNQRTFGGRYEHHLVRAGDDWKIAKKIVRLVNCDGVLKNVGVPI